MSLSITHLLHNYRHKLYFTNTQKSTPNFKTFCCVFFTLSTKWSESRNKLINTKNDHDGLMVYPWVQALLRLRAGGSQPDTDTLSKN